MPLPFPLNSSLTDLPVYEPGRPIEEVARELGLQSAKVIKLASNENPLGPSPRALAAMQQAATQSHLYPDGNAFYLKRRLAEQLGVDTRNLILGNGSNEIIEFVGHALMDADSEVVVSQYCFAVYPLVTHLFGAKLITVPARDYGHDLDAMLAAVTPETRVLFVANPNNPTGTLASRESLDRLVAGIPDHVVLVLDEAYIEFLDDPRDFTPLVGSGDKPNLILMRTFSKIHGLAGLRIGYGIGHPEFVAALERVRQPFNTNAIAQAAALAALDDDEHVERTRRNNSEGLRFLEQGLKELGLDTLPSHANFILAKVGHGSGVTQELQKLGVIVRPMGGYQLPDWIRISVGTPVENARGMEALKRVLRK
jgi:histidinol-phosphate aminotransferase